MESETVSRVSPYSTHNPEDEIPNLLPNREEVFKARPQLCPATN